jgi:predicted AlkP superfamily pyrophosphatase or phosphodiesterase
MRRIQKAAAVCLLFLLSACAPDAPDIYFYGDPLPPPHPLVHVFLIGIDGWGSYSLPKANMPLVKKMLEEGSSTLNNMNVLPTGSIPNWASMLYGTTPAFHGFAHNTPVSSFVQVIIDEYGYFPNIFALVKAKIPECQVAALSQYGDIIKIIPRRLLNHGVEGSDVEDVLAYIDTINPDMPSFTFIQFDEVDGAGHSGGHNSEEYYQALVRVDGYLSRIGEALENRGMNADTVFIVTADHGGIFLKINRNYSGTFFQHGGNTLEERQVPLIFYGKNIKRGFAIPGSPHIYDIVPTVAKIFEIPVPPVWIGRALSEVFE